MAIEYKAGYTYVNGETQTTTKANAAQTARTIECATNKLLGRSTAGTGPIEEIDCPAAARALLAATDAAAQRATLGVSATSEVLLLANNLSDLDDPEQARINLGVGEVRVRCTAQTDVTSTSFSDITGMQFTIDTGVTATVDAWFQVVAPNETTGAVISVTGTAVFSAFDGFYTPSASSAQDVSRHISAFPATVTLIKRTESVVHVSVTFTCSTGGTLKFQVAQESASGGTTSVKVGSWARLFSYE